MTHQALSRLITVEDVFLNFFLNLLLVIVSSQAVAGGHHNAFRLAPRGGSLLPLYSLPLYMLASLYVYSLYNIDYINLYHIVYMI